MARVEDDELFADEVVKSPKESTPAKKGERQAQTKGQGAKGVALFVVIAWFIVGFLAGYTYKTMMIRGQEDKAKVLTPPPLTAEQLESGERPPGHPEIKSEPSQ